MNLPPFIRVQGSGVVLSVKAQPRASRTEVVGLFGDVRHAIAEL
jgi:uncharacterized protein YggU (UPF0235/DUF167 family)